MTTTEVGTIDHPAATTVPAEHYISSEGEEIPGLVVAVDLASLGVGGRWEFDAVLAIEDNEIVLLFRPDNSDEGWDRLSEVGEW